MNNHERRELKNDIDKALDELDFEISYKVNSNHKQDTTVFDIEFIFDSNFPDDWDKDVEDAISEVARNKGGWTSWDDWILCLSIPDDDDK